MQVIFKAREGRAKDAAKAVAKKLGAILSERAAEGVKVRQVFPGLTSGQRARLFTVDLPDDLSEQEVRAAVEGLRDDEALEYAELPAPKSPMSAGARDGAK